jgi:hypothetical protein
MSTFFGADVGELRQLAGTFENAAAQLTRTRTSVGGNVQSSPWTGPVAFRFRSSWDSQSSTQLAAAADRLTNAAASLRKNADEQEGASAANGSGSSPIGASPSHPSLPSLPSIQDFLLTQAVAVGGLALDGRDYLRALAAGGKFSTLAQFADGLKDAKVGPALSFISMGFSANDLGVALATGDTSKQISSVLDLAASTAGIFIPGAGLAWEGGKFIGTEIANGVEQVWDYQGGAVAEGAREMFGNNVDMNNLSVEQSTQLAQRYEGLGGYGRSITDSINGAGHDLGAVEAQGAQALVNATSNVVQDVGRAAGDAVSGVDNIAKSAFGWMTGK